jgi:hypothetical protein
MTLLLDVTTDGIEGSPIPKKRLTQQPLKQPLHLPPCNGVPCGMHQPGINLSFCFFSFFNFRFSFKLCVGFFFCSLLPLSFFQLSLIAVSPFLLTTFLETPYPARTRPHLHLRQVQVSVATRPIPFGFQPAIASAMLVALVEDPRQGGRIRDTPRYALSKGRAGKTIPGFSKGFIIIYLPGSDL